MFFLATRMPCKSARRMRGTCVQGRGGPTHSSKGIGCACNSCHDTSEMCGGVCACNACNRTLGARAASTAYTAWLSGVMCLWCYVRAVRSCGRAWRSMADPVRVRCNVAHCRGGRSRHCPTACGLRPSGRCGVARRHGSCGTRVGRGAQILRVLVPGCPRRQMGLSGSPLRPTFGYGRNTWGKTRVGRDPRKARPARRPTEKGRPNSMDNSTTAMSEGARATRAHGKARHLIRMGRDKEWKAGLPRERCRGKGRTRGPRLGTR